VWVLWGSGGGGGGLVPRKATKTEAKERNYTLKNKKRKKGCREKKFPSHPHWCAQIERGRTGDTDKRKSFEKLQEIFETLGERTGANSRVVFPFGQFHFREKKRKGAGGTEAPIEIEIYSRESDSISIFDMENLNRKRTGIRRGIREG